MKRLIKLTPLMLLVIALLIPLQAAFSAADGAAEIITQVDECDPNVDPDCLPETLPDTGGQPVIPVGVWLVLGALVGVVGGFFVLRPASPTEDTISTT